MYSYAFLIYFIWNHYDIIYNTFYYTNESRKIVSNLLKPKEIVYSDDWVLCDEDDQVLTSIPHSELKN